MKVTCNLCHQEVDSGKIDLEKGIAKCVDCNNVFDCRSQLEPTANIRRETITLPSGIKLEKSDQWLHMEYRWLSSQLLYLTPFCLAWDTIPFFWTQESFPMENSQITILYGVIYLLLGVWLNYYCLAGFLNTTKISVTGGNLQVKDTPLTFLKNRKINHDDLDQLYAKEKMHKGRKIFWSSFEVHVITKSGEVYRLVGGLSDSEQALYIEQILEEHLGIQDRPVQGELPR